MNQKKSRDIAQDFFESQIGIDIVKDGPPRICYLANIKTSKIMDDDLIERNVLLLYFIEQNGEWFKAYLKYEPYFYIGCPIHLAKEIISYLEKKFEGKISSIDIEEKVDLELTNHLSGLKIKFLKLNFKTINDLVFVRNTIKPYVEKKKMKENDISLSETLFSSNETKITDYMDVITDIREYDIPYHTRVCIDLEIRLSYWYQIKFSNNFISSITCLKNMVERPDFRIFAFDIETTKLPLKFPDSKIDNIMMISITLDGSSFLITNRNIISKDVIDFEFAPKKEYESSIIVFNEINEKALLLKFFSFIKETKPFILTSFNGDMFDWPFIEARAVANNLSIEEEIGIKNEDGEYFGRYLVHLDCFYWVERDSYLPQGSHGLKAVCKSKLGYDPIEVDPEQMVPLARQNPQYLAEYSISDSIATYYLYKRHIHDFIFALGTIIPMNPDEVLRKGSGTLCENLLMAAAYQRNIIFPNKKKESTEKFHQGHLLDNETYIGGRVEGLTSGVYRNDLPTRFTLEPKAYQTLIDNLDHLFEFVFNVENQINKADVTNYNEIKSEITKRLKEFVELPNPSAYDVKPLVYHLDVAAMYPNIILTNRLQPVSIVSDKICSGCVFNLPENNCKKVLEWQWKGDYFPLSRSEYEMLKYQLEYEQFNKNAEIKVNMFDPTVETQQALLKKRVKLYSQKTYKKYHDSKIELKENTICMRENSFYVDTVRAFRDRRYEFKNLVKVYKNKYDEAIASNDQTKALESKELVNLYESLQLAHKVILNSFYGYVMRKGARWYSMEMAAMVTHMGSNIIREAKGLVDLIGKPLELDTDGIWCLLPNGFPENFTFKLKNGKAARFSYPCSILNILIYEKYLNNQYQTLIDENTLRYDTKSEMSIFFEIDGPYKAMILPAAREEGKQLKKRYAVYNLNGSLAEVKGFELKRRGELKILKIFQTQIFSEFLTGTTLEECYEACGKVAQRWLDILLNKGIGLDDAELIEYIGESRVLSKSLMEYEAKKGVAITAAKRLSEFLGEDIIQGKGLNCHFIISRKPIGTPVNERAIPISIFSTDDPIKRKFLKKWMKESETRDFDIKEILDWDYYIERLGNAIQKIIVIPAAWQKIKNPVPCVPYPEWLNKLVKDADLNFQQKKLENYFEKKEKVSIISVAKPHVDEKLPKDKVHSTPIKPAKPPKPSLPVEEINKFDFDTDFKNWLATQKNIWVNNHKRQNGTHGRTPVSGIRNLFLSQEQMYMNSTWHIIQIQNTDLKGIFKLWVHLENKQIFSVRVKIPRVLYLNSKETEKKSSMYHVVKKKLPRERKQFSLYEIKVNEEDFIKKYNQFDYFITNPDTEGVYESKIPLSFSFLVQHGSLLRPNKNIAKPFSFTSHTFNSEDFHGIFNPEKPYLFDFEVPKVFFAEVKMKDKSVWGVFCPFMGEFDFLLVHKNVDSNNYGGVVREGLKGDEEFRKMERTKIKVHNVENNDGVIAFIEKKLHYLQDNFRNPFLLIFQTNCSMKKLRTLLNEFPYLPLPGISAENLNYSALDWQKKGIKLLCENYVGMPDFLKQLIDFCRYCHVPIGNLEGDKLIFAIDLFYSRILRSANCISWYSDTSSPDLGGANDDDYRTIIPTDYIYSEIVRPKLYNHYCVEVDIELLALNTICVGDELKNIDKEASNLVETKQNDALLNNFDNVDEITLTKTAFKYVKMMVNGWLEDVIKSNNPFADTLIQNVHRWLCLESSKLYDPFLNKILVKLMKKVFGYLLNKLKSLGATIIFANTNKLIISTGKDNYAAAENYTNFILTTIVSYPLFTYLNLDSSRYWKILLFKDNFNYAGIMENDNKFLMEMNIGRYLPKKFDHYFSGLIAEYIYKIYNHKIDIIKRNMEETSELIIHHHDIEERLKEFSKKYVSESLNSKFYNLLPEIIKLHRLYKIEMEKKKELDELEENLEYQDDEADEIDSVISNAEEYFEEERIKRDKQAQKREKELNEWEFPKLLGRVFNNNNIILEFINFIFHILNLDENIYEELIVLKRNCLKFLQTSDYSEDAQYKEPVRKVVIEEIMCSQCYYVCEIDLFRSKSVQDKKKWTCLNCSHPYDMKYIENKIVRFIKNNLILYQIQDIYCSKCKMAQEDVLSRLCKCSGKFKLSINEFSNPLANFYEEIKTNLKEFAVINEFHYMSDILENMN